MAEEKDTGGFTLPPEQSAWSSIDWKPLLIGTAMSLSPELAPMAPLFMKAFQDGTKNAQAKRFAQGMQGVQKLYAEGNTQAAQNALAALTEIAPKEMLTSLSKFQQGMMEQSQQQQFTSELTKVAQGAKGLEKVLPFLPPKDQIAAVSPRSFSHEGTVMNVNPTTGQPMGTMFLPQAPRAPDTAAFAEQAARQGMTPAQISNAINSTDPEMQQAGLNVLKGTQTAADLQKIQMVGQEATARTAATESTRLGFMGQETEKLADRAEKTGFASVMGKTEAEKFTFLANPIGEKAGEFIDTETLQPAAPNLTGQDVVKSGRFRPMSATKQVDLREKVQATESYNQAIREMRQIVADNPDLFPKSGSIGKNVVKQFELYSKNLLKDVDPKYLAAFAKLDALQAGAARYAKAWGDVGAINTQEQLKQVEAMGLRPGLKESVESRLNLLEKMMSEPVNQYMEQQGMKWRVKSGATKPLSLDEAMKKFGVSPSAPAGNPQ